MQGDVVCAIIEAQTIAVVQIALAEHTICDQDVVAVELDVVVVHDFSLFLHDRSSVDQVAGVD